MSDLHQAIQAEIAAHQPGRPPSFDALKARKRARDRTRGCLALAAPAFTATAVVLVPSLLGQDARSSLVQGGVASPGPSRTATNEAVAAWLIDPARPPAADDLSFTALVLSVACPPEGEVFAPSVDETAERVVITFTVPCQPPQPGVAFTGALPRSRTASRCGPPSVSDSCLMAPATALRRRRRTTAARCRHSAGL